MELLFLEPIFKTRIWGGNRLKTDFGYNIPSNQTGECWAISAHQNGQTKIKNGEFAGLLLSEVWHQNPNLFANTKAREFPLLVKILDANTDLSVQVHPDDKFAQLVENDLGKAECWYVLAAAPGAQIVYGHNAQSIEEFKQLALENQWDDLLNNVAVKAGDFYDVPTGTVHALGAGTLILEVQQSSDTTYRLYDYARKDDHGNLRELHLEKAFAVINAPHEIDVAVAESRSLGLDADFKVLTKNSYFQVGKLSVNGQLDLTLTTKYLLVSVIDGSGLLNGISIKKGDHFIVPNPIRNLHFSGNLELITCNEE